MNLPWNDLAELLEEEIALGEELQRNLATQRQALVAWDIEALIGGIEAREPWLRCLTELEKQRLEVLKEYGQTDAGLTLSRLISKCPEDLPERRRLQNAQARAHAIFARLQKDERSLTDLMENILIHLHEALLPLARPPVSLYGDSGATAALRPQSALIRSKV